MKSWLVFLVALLTLSGCNIEDVPQAHVGRVFEQSIVGSSAGFIGPILQPGSHSIGLNNEMKLVQCSESTVKETMISPASDSITFNFDIYVKFQPNCNDPKAVEWILNNIQPNPSLQPVDAQKGGAPEADKLDHAVSSYQLFYAYVRPALGEALRDAVSGYRSDQINGSRTEISTKLVLGVDTILKSVREKSQRPDVVIASQITLSNIEFPKEMLQKFEQLANKKTETQIEIQEQARVAQEIITEQKKKELAEAKATQQSVQFEEIGKVLRANPEYLEYLRIQQLPEVAKNLSANGSTLIVGSDGLNMFLGGKK